MSAAYSVKIADAARHDLLHLRDYLVAAADIATADRVVEKLLLAIDSLGEFPKRGPRLEEFRDLHIKQYRQTSVPPYRIVFKIDHAQVTVLVVADGRRDFKQLLRDRLLR